MRTASWVVREKLTGKVVFETFDPEKVQRLNAAKYEAVPILEYLGQVNRAIREAAAALNDLTLLGAGADITGREVQYWGDVWTVKGRNYLGDWDVVRYELRPDGRVRVTSSVRATVLPEDHPHFCSLVTTN
jgi:hypothetical protein